MQKGYEVYKAASSAYPADLVAIDEGDNVQRVKVKTVRRRADGSVSIPEIPDDVNVLALVIDGEVHYQKAAGVKFVSKL